MHYKPFSTPQPLSAKFIAYCTKCHVEIDHAGWCDPCAKEFMESQVEVKEAERRKGIETIIDLLYEQRTLK
jgi:hypothetical protein